MDKLKRLKITIQNRLNEARNNGTGVARVMNSTLSEMLEVVNQEIKADKVEVVRCKDCKWWDKKEGSNYGYCHACKHGHISDHWEIGIYRTYKGDWFCAEGERKEGGGT